jgi:purine-nucleoside phosphorylase
MTDLTPALDRITATLKARGIAGTVDCALVLGTGLGPIADAVTDAITVPYAELEGFPVGNVTGHAKRLVCGTLAGRRVLIFQGRSHYYERGEAGVMRLPVALLTRLGSPPLILTNAAGSTRLDVPPGSLSLITDHINLSGANPLIGDPEEARFVSMTDAYDSDLRAALRDAALKAHIALHEGVYMWFSGPSFETPAEIRMAQMLGADLVGMSTVPEVILARRHGLRVAAISTITNLAAGIRGASPSHGETQAVAQTAAADLQAILHSFLAGLPDDQS